MSCGYLCMPIHHSILEWKHWSILFQYVTAHMLVHSNNTDKQHSSELVKVIIQARGLIINLAGSPPAKKQSCWTRRWLNTSMVTFLETHIVNYSYFGTRYISRQLWGKNPQSEQPEYSITSINSWKFPNEHLQEEGEASLAIPSKNVSYSDHKIHELLTLYVARDFLSSDAVRRKYNLHATIRPTESNTPEHQLPILQIIAM